MRNFFKKSGRTRDIVKSLSFTSESTNDQLYKNNNNGTTVVDGARNGGRLDGSMRDGINQLNGDCIHDIDTLRSAEAYCNNQNDDYWQRRKHLSRPIMRIVSDKEFLSFFVQFLEVKSALAFIKFWIDADSFKSSAELCITASAGPAQTERWRSPIPHRPQSANSERSDVSPRRRLLSKSVSLNIGAFERGEPEETISLGAYSELLDNELARAEADGEQPTTIENNKEHVTKCNSQNPSASGRLLGDGSSQTNSMTNVSDICDYGAVDSKVLAAPVTGTPKARTISSEAEEDDDEESGEIDLPSKRDAVAEGKSDSPPIRSKRNIHSELVTDAKRIFHKYLVGTAAPYRVEVPAIILSQIITGLGRLTADETAFDYCNGIASIFTEAQQHVLNQLENDYVDAFLESSFYHFYCIETLTTVDSTIHITDILYNEAALFYFMEFVEQENQRAYFDFWISAVNFQRQTTTIAGTMDNYDAQQAQSDALILYEKFFSLQATQPLHLSDSVRFGVEEKICSESGRIDDCFDVPLAIVERFFGQRYLPTFVKSPLFQRFLTELRQKTDGHAPNVLTATNIEWNANGIDRPTQRKTSSDCTSDKVLNAAMRRSISSQNTLLAMDGSKKRRATSTTAMAPSTMPSHSNMLIDSRQLHDPDLLWKRNVNAGLTFGRIDELGRYERNYETVPIGVTDVGGLAASSKFKQAVRKLVNLKEDSVQQEIAWQVAEMIVKEITSVTLNRHTTPESQL